MLVHWSTMNQASIDSGVTRRCQYHGIGVPLVPSQVLGRKPGQSRGTSFAPDFAKGEVQCSLQVSLQ
jgi:hypothetical protein